MQHPLAHSSIQVQVNVTRYPEFGDAQWTSGRVQGNSTITATLQAKGENLQGAIRPRIGAHVLITLRGTPGRERRAGSDVPAVVTDGIPAASQPRQLTPVRFPPSRPVSEHPTISSSSSSYRIADAICEHHRQLLMVDVLTRAMQECDEFLRHSRYLLGSIRRSLQIQCPSESV